MKKLIGGAIAVLFGVVGISVFFPSFLTLLAGMIPIMLIIGGGLTIYLNYESDTPDFNDTSDTADSNCCSSTPAGSYDSTPPKDIAGVSTHADAKLLGNTESSVFHKPECNFAKSKNCTAVFNTREDAVKEGYKPCRICNP